MDLIQTVSRVTKVCRKYQLRLVLTFATMTFVYHGKALNSVETNVILSALIDQAVDLSYVRILADCYRNCTTTTPLFCRSLIIPIIKGIRQGDTVLPELFTGALQWIMKWHHWDESGICMNGIFLSNMRFTKDIVIFLRSGSEAETILNELGEARISGRRIKKKKDENNEKPILKANRSNLKVIW